MKFIDEDDGLPLVLSQLLEHGLEAFLEFAPIFGASQQGRHVQSQYALVAQTVGHLVVDDPLGQSFDDGGFSDAGFADQHRVVLGSALQDLDDPADFIIPSDDRVQFAEPSPFGEIQGVFLERFARSFAVLAGDSGPAAQGFDRLFQTGALSAMLAEQASHLALVVAQGQQKKFGGDERILAFLGFPLRQIEQGIEISGDADLSARGGKTGDPLQQGGQPLFQGLYLNIGTGQQCGRGSILLVQKGLQQMYRLDVGMVMTQRQTLRIGKGFLKFGGQFVKSHGALLNHCGS
uniref:Uncharacterized protein n=1 Tax=uncultured prokaryote TaxID=198431 RepID=M1GPA1_9ZZZZ|nr:hypothetical protein Bpseu9_09100 [uncultured prokaryote]